MIETRALLLTDIVDSTKLSEQLGDAAMAALWAAHDRVARDLLVAHDGREIDKTDGFLLLFDDVGAAVAYAVEYHRAIGRLDPPLKARAGVHLGDVILTENRPDDVARGAKPLEVDGAAKPVAARVMSVAMGGQTLLSSAARGALGPTELRVEAHGHWRMKGVSEPVALFEIGDDAAPFQPPPDGAKVHRVVRQGDLWLPVKQLRYHLPAERDAFAGRRADLDALARALDGGARLVSVLGMGGTGKTRLVTRYAWQWLGDWPGGVWFCDLSEARSSAGICQSVARVLDVPLGSQDPVAQLGYAIAGRGRCLVVLDNFEQVSAYARETVGRWLDLAHEARFVVTSREVLGLPGETALALAPLEAEDAVALFVARAQQANRGFELLAADRSDVERLVELLDRLPLAIELAASRARVLSPAKMLDRLSQRFKLLASSTGGRHTRQATLRGALDWSWELLTPDEQVALAQLSVFEGGFDLASAEAVLALEEAWPMDAVQALVDKSLVRPVADERFDLLVSVQEYAAEQLDALGQREPAEVRHGVWCAGFGTLEALDRHDGVNRLSGEPDLHNFAVGCRRAVRRVDGPVAAAALRAAWRVLATRGPYSLGAELAESVLKVPLEPVDRCSAFGCAGAAAGNLGRMPEAVAHYQDALALARVRGLRQLEGRVLCNLGGVYQRTGQRDEARTCFELALELARTFSNSRSEALVLGNLGLMCADAGQLAEAQVLYEQSLGIARATGDLAGVGRVTGNLGNLLVDQGRTVEAHARYGENLDAARELGDRGSETAVLANIALLYAEQGHLGEARSHHEQALRIAREMGDRRSEGIALGNLGSLHLTEARPSQARDCFERALQIHRDVRFAYGQGYWLWGLARLEASAGSERWRDLVDEAVAVSAPFPVVHTEALAVRATLRVAAGAIGDARTDVDAARGLRPDGGLAVIVALADARTAHAEGRMASACGFLAQATERAEASRVGPKSAIGLEIAAVQELLADHEPGGAGE